MGESVPYINPLWPEAVWDVSGAFASDRELLAFFDFCKDVLGFEPFHLVHGSPLFGWNSGRIVKHLLRETEEIRAAGLAYAQRGIAMYLTFSNPLLREEHLKDVLGNALLKFFAAHNPTQRNGVIISSDLLLKHVRQEYPSLRCVSSILNIVDKGGKNRLDIYQQLAEQYDEVMVHPDDVLNDELLLRLGEKDRYICLVNEYCIRQCPLRVMHYRTHSANALDFFGYDSSEFNKLQQKNGCADLRHMLCHEKNGVLALNTPELQHLYDLGFRHFKLQGRGHTNASAILFDLIRLALRQDAPSENMMHAVSQRLMEYLSTPLFS